MTLIMWQLIRAGRDGKKEIVGSFEEVQGAAERIIELERYTVEGIFFDILVHTDLRFSEEEPFDYLEHTGKTTGRCYVVKRVRH
jgi:hypothetical protein